MVSTRVLHMPYGDGAVPQGTTRWSVSWQIAEFKPPPEDEGDFDPALIPFRYRSFPNPIAARRYAKGLVRRRKTFWGVADVQEERAEQMEYGPIGVGEWIDVGEPETFS